MILASKSPRRHDLMGTYGVPFSVITADVQEMIEASDIKMLPQINASLKAEAVSVLNPNDLVIGADTIICFENQVIGKPKSLEQAKEILLMLSGKKHEVISGVALRHQARNIKEDFSVTSIVKFKILTNCDIDHYLKQVNVLDKAGAYAIQEHGEDIISQVEGEVDNIIGLPCKELFKRLDFYGYRKKTG